MTTVQKWFENKKWIPQEFQKKCWKAYSEGKSGMLHAPTGSGKTFALWGGILNEAQLKKKHPAGIQAIWITPLRALAVEIQQATQSNNDDDNDDNKI